MLAGWQAWPRLPVWNGQAFPALTQAAFGSVNVFLWRIQNNQLAD